MRFFKGTDGQYYPTRDIVWIGKEREVKTKHGTSKVHFVKMNKAAETEIWSYELKNIVEDDNATTIPAAPGTYMLHGFDGSDGEDDQALKSLVIGWRVSSAGDPEPFTADGINDGIEGWATILMPDGTVVRPGSQTWETQASWEADERATLAAYKAKRTDGPSDE